MSQSNVKCRECGKVIKDFSMVPDFILSDEDFPIGLYELCRDCITPLQLAHIKKYFQTLFLKCFKNRQDTMELIGWLENESQNEVNCA